MTVGLYLSMLSSQVSPTRSSSESDCRWKKKQISVMAADKSVLCCCLIGYLVRVDHIRTAVTGVSHPIIVSVFLVWVGDSLAVVKNILQTWEEKKKEKRWQENNRKQPTDTVCQMHQQMAVFVWDEGEIVSSGLQCLAEAYRGKMFLERRQTWPSPKQSGLGVKDITKWSKGWRSARMNEQQSPNTV